jgi:DNA adenine methylase
MPRELSAVAGRQHGGDPLKVEEVLHATPAAVLLSGYPSGLYEELYAGWWRLERTVQRPTSNVSGGRGAVATEVLWSNRPLAHQARLLDPAAGLRP